MSILLPSKTIELPGGYRWEPQLLDAQHWQAHLLKHPLGLYALREERDKPWNTEGWDSLTPPVADGPRRERAFEQIRAACTATSSCKVPEVFGQAWSGENPRPQCYLCKPPILEICITTLAADEIAQRYARVTEDVVRSVEHGVEVSRRALGRLVTSSAGRRKIWLEASVMAVGRLRAGDGIHIVRADGVVVHLLLGSHGVLRWRTTFRGPARAEAEGGFGLLRALPDFVPELSLSDHYVVPRAWWQQHGN